MENLGVPKTEDKNDKTVLWHLATVLPWALLLATWHVTQPRPPPSQSSRAFVQPTRLCVCPDSAWGQWRHGLSRVQAGVTQYLGRLVQEHSLPPVCTESPFISFTSAAFLSEFYLQSCFWGLARWTEGAEGPTLPAPDRPNLPTISVLPQRGHLFPPVNLP